MSILVEKTSRSIETKTKMAISISKIAYFVLFILCVSSKNAESEPQLSNFIDFERIKYDLFTKRDTIFAIKNSTFSDQQFEEVAEKCTAELKHIQNGLLNSEFWAMKCK